MMSKAVAVAVREVGMGLRVGMGRYIILDLNGSEVSGYWSDS